MLARSLAALDARGLRLALALFFVALAAPAALLIWHAHGQLKWAAFHQQQELAAEVAGRIDARYAELLAREEARSFADYAFLVVAGDPAQNFVQRSPLSAFPVAPSVPGLVGYFQVDARGVFSTPLVPVAGDAASYGVSEEELSARRAAQAHLWRILNANRLVGTAAGARTTGDGASAAPSARREDATAEKAERSAVAKRADEARQTDAAPAPDAPAGALTGGGESTQAARAEKPDAAPQEERATEAESAQAPFDALVATDDGDAAAAAEKLGNVLGRVSDLRLDASRYAGAESDAQAAYDKRAARKERAAVPETLVAPAAPATAEAPTAGTSVAGGELRVRTFESEVDPFAFRPLDSGHFVLFRNVWREGQRQVQGMLLAREPFLRDVIEEIFRTSTLAATSALVVAERGDVLALYGEAEGPGDAYDAAQLEGALLHRVHLSAPLGALELIFSVRSLPPAPGANLLYALAVVLALVLCGGFWLMYRLGAGQIALARQQQDFVSAVSHELKTPLTSIRMYGEMLRAGWGTDTQKQAWYDFIYGESERLSRLITNVLQLARMNRNELPLTLKAVTGAELLDGIRSKTGAQIERAGFALAVECDEEAARATVVADVDAVLQIVINLVDNAIKFSAKAAEKRIEITLRKLDGALVLSVRDHGPGVPADQARRIFELFYRAEDELTRETAGTGIGLALVRQLARAMNARVDVVGRDPGAEFRVRFAP
jgi:two-component system, OmpR family, phosphate regulon sensor histidine kinase PhoR